MKKEIWADDVCPKCGGKIEIMIYQPEEDLPELYLASCENKCCKCKDWHLSEQDAISDILDKEQNEVIVSLGRHFIGCELFAKIKGNVESIPYKKEGLLKLLERIVEKAQNE